ncbi:MIP18 family protein galla-2 [Frankliniella fusca]|uniref:MIP18 family protein galla-2 n=1 Tax=Frankliniella fusca TaxID=407009 RepID=A0AAE1HTM4_9NEOP|nr:MIP18 family protein galla-2 [Frankliniella fusca]
MTPSTGSPVLENKNPTLYQRTADREITPEELDDTVVDPFDAREIFDLIRNITDPEHPLSLEELNVVEERLCQVDDQSNTVDVTFTPTIPHCSMATLIGLCIRVKLLHSLPTRFKVTVKISPGAHVSEAAINKQLADKERVAAALENNHLIKVINECIFAAKPTFSKIERVD